MMLITDVQRKAKTIHRLLSLALLGVFLFANLSRVTFAQTANPHSEDRAITNLLKILHTSKDPSLVLDAASSLAQIGSPAVPVLIRVLQTSKDNTMRTRVCEAFGQLGPTAAPAVSELVTTLKTAKDNTLRIYAAQALEKIGPKARPARTARSSPNPPR